ncbi:hypothetical protein GCK72_010482 [Caenorhabditis remanei]|uniref:Uncharacterized protein n=1 Tax=Caenorhabditis remanei TaxID=31234 RepID=A0A6A5H301_CAERE|nr:hypothetical protein GCK72_010482 [Caenorhabditis remanei]KAF1762220.1 hypothetical protein GCK72_010482 [Caenorhabditis remanei]
MEMETNLSSNQSTMEDQVVKGELNQSQEKIEMQLNVVQLLLLSDKPLIQSTTELLLPSVDLLSNVGFFALHISADECRNICIFSTDQDYRDKREIGADEVCSEAEFTPNHTDNWPFGETRQSAKKKKINMNQEETGNAQRQGIKNRKRKEEMIVVMSQKKGKEMGNWAKIHNNKNGEI